jgi:glutathione S-transferase
VKEQMFSDSFSEAIFAQAVVDDFEQEMVNSRDDNAPIQFSERHKRRMDAMFSREQRQVRFKRIFTGARRVAAAIALFTVLSMSLLAVPAVRAAVGSVIEWFDEYVQFSGADTASDGTRREPSYLPDGFIETDRVNENSFLSITYTGASGKMLMFICIPADDSISVNNEDVEYGQTTKEGIVYHTFSAENEDYMSSVVWDLAGNRYCVGAQLPIADLLAIAQSVELVK